MIRKQRSVSLSSTEAEFVSMCTGVQEAMWIREWLFQTIAAECVITLYGDNQSALTIAASPSMNDRTKHISTRLYYMYDLIRSGTVLLRWIDGASQIADILTKPLGSVKLCEHRDKLLYSPV